MYRQRLKETEDLVLRGRKESIHLVEKLAETETELATQVKINMECWLPSLE